jgi:hypothetical protein
MTDYNVIRFPEKGGSGGDGPEDPPLERRVLRLEHILERLEPRITEILLTGAKQSDVQKVHVDLAELKGRMAAVEAKVGALPSTFVILTIVFTTWALGSGILIFALNLLRR